MAYNIGRGLRLVILGILFLLCGWLVFIVGQQLFTNGALLVNNPTPTPTAIVTPTPAPTGTSTPTSTPTVTLTATPTLTATSTPTITPTSMPPATPTNTAVPNEAEVIRGFSVESPMYIGESQTFEVEVSGAKRLVRLWVNDRLVSAYWVLENGELDPAKIDMKRVDSELLLQLAHEVSVPEGALMLKVVVINDLGQEGGVGGHLIFSGESE